MVSNMTGRGLETLSSCETGQSLFSLTNQKSDFHPVRQITLLYKQTLQQTAIPRLGFYWLFSHFYTTAKNCGRIMV